LLTDHCDYLLELTTPQPEFGIKLFDALGLTLCENIKGDGNVPSADLAEADGYAIRASDTEYANEDLQAVGQLVMLPVVEQAPVLVKGTAVRVTAGEPMPLGADVVVPLELTEQRADEHIALLRVMQSGEWVRPAGADVTDREVFAHSGQIITETLLGLLAAAGMDRVLARPAARVSVLSFDDVADLEAVGTTDRRGRHLRSACSFLISSALRNDNATVWRTDITDLDLEGLHEPIDSELVRSDLIVATSAVGIAAVRDELARLGAVDCCRVAMEPGGDQVFALIGERKVPTFLLPADPVAAFFSYHMFVRPVLRKLMGTLPHRPQPKLCFASDDMVSQAGVFELYPAKVRQAGGRFIATQCGRRGLSTLADLAQANAIVALPEDKAEVSAGEPIQAWEF
jgi:molybdopterin molybdotransferase